MYTIPMYTYTLTKIFSNATFINFGSGNDRSEQFGQVIQNIGRLFLVMFLCLKLEKLFPNKQIEQYCRMMNFQ